MRSHLVALLLLASATLTHAQKPVYLCEGVYTDKPCKNGREVDIAPTRGAHSMSGKRQESQEAVIERVTRDMNEAQVKGTQQGVAIMRCDDLRRRREAIDLLGQPDSLKDERFRIREEQFKLNCRQT